MNSYLFLLPLYNDWDSLLILHEKINEQIKTGITQTSLETRNKAD